MTWSRPGPHKNTRGRDDFEFVSRPSQIAPAVTGLNIGCGGPISSYLAVHLVPRVRRNRSPEHPGIRDVATVENPMEIKANSKQTLYYGQSSWPQSCFGANLETLATFKSRLLGRT